MSAFSFSALPVFATGTVNVIHSANRLPLNSASDGAISVCFVNTSNSSETILQNSPTSVSNPVSLVAGNYNYYITSFVRSSADGSLMDPCNFIGSEYILSTGIIAVTDGQSYNLTFSGQGQLTEPRGTSDFQTQTPFYRQNSTSGTPRLYVSYPDFFVDETGTRYNGALYSSDQVCYDDGATGGPINVDTSVSGLGGSLPFTVTLSPGVRIFPPSINGTCVDIFANPTAMPYVEIPAGYNTAFNTFIRFDVGGRVSGFSTSFVASSVATAGSNSPTTASGNSTTTTNSSTTSRNRVGLIRTGGQKETAMVIFAIALILFGVFLADSFYAKAQQD